MYNNEVPKYGMYTDDINLKNNVMMGNPTAKAFYPTENYNFNIVDNAILYKNLFKVFVHFDVHGVFDVSVGDTVHLEFMRKTTGSKNELLTGNYTVYGISHVFENKMKTHFICSAPFFQKSVNNFSGTSSGFNTAPNLNTSNIGG